MKDFKRIEAIDFDFFPKDLYLINKNAEKFNTLTMIYSEYPFEELVASFFKYGNKRFQTKKARLEFLAVYQAILNHEDLMPTQDKLQMAVEEQFVRLGYPPIAENNAKQEDAIVSEEVENSGEATNDEEFVACENGVERDEFTQMNNYDIQHKWGRILTRIEEIKDYVDEVIQNVVENYEQNPNNQQINQANGEEQVYVAKTNLPTDDYMFR